MIFAPRPLVEMRDIAAWIEQEYRGLERVQRLLDRRRRSRSPPVQDLPDSALRPGGADGGRSEANALAQIVVDNSRPLLIRPK